MNNRVAEIEHLTPAAFASFGTFRNMLNPDSPDIGKPPIQFFPDVLRLDMGGKSVLGISTCLVYCRPPVVDTTEFHSSTGEGILPLNTDILIHVAEPTGNGLCPADKIRIFRVPKGTCVVLHPGVWHHAPFVWHDKQFAVGGFPSASVLILLPVRTYANDCRVERLPVEKQTQVKA